MKGADLQKELVPLTARFFAPNGFWPHKNLLRRTKNTDGIQIDIDFGAYGHLGDVRVAPHVFVYWDEFSRPYFEYQREERKTNPLIKPRRNDFAFSIGLENLGADSSFGYVDPIYLSEFASVHLLSKFLVNTYGEKFVETANQISSPAGILDFVDKKPWIGGSNWAFLRTILIRNIYGQEAAVEWAAANIDNVKTIIAAEQLRYLVDLLSTK